MMGAINAKEELRTCYLPNKLLDMYLPDRDWGPYTLVPITGMFTFCSVNTDVIDHRTKFCTDCTLLGW